MFTKVKQLLVCSVRKWVTAWEKEVQKDWKCDG